MGTEGLEAVDGVAGNATYRAEAAYDFLKMSAPAADGSRVGCIPSPRRPGIRAADPVVRYVVAADFPKDPHANRKDGWVDDDEGARDTGENLHEVAGDEELDTTICRSGPMVPGRSPKACAVLVVLNGPEIGNQYPLRRTKYTIGRAPDAEISIRTDAQISRFHARLTVEFDEEERKARYLLTDLGSLNQTIVNGAPIEQCLLSDRDKVQIGDTTLRFSILDEVEARFHSAIHKRLRLDQLTGLLTRESCDLALESEIRRCAQRGHPLSLLMMDIDFFRSVNESYGHQAGSEVLAQMGHLLAQRLRGFDLVSRFGGEEFLAGLAETNKTHALAIAERIRQAVESTEFTWQDQTVRVTISIGVAGSPDDGYSLGGLIKRADLALYRSKHEGRNRVTVWDEALDGAPDDSGESEVA